MKNALIDLGVSINVMTKDTMHRLSIEGLRTSPIVLQLADSSTITPNGIIEDIVAILDSWEYPTYFMILSPKVTLVGYPVILGWPWLAIVDANISYHSCNMTISDGQTINKLSLYPLAQPQLDLSNPIWFDLGDEVEEINSIAQLMMLQKNISCNFKKMMMWFKAFLPMTVL